MPGNNSARSIGWRVASGSICICSCVTTPDTSVLLVSMIGASPVTVTDSFSPCTCIVRFRVVSLPTVTVTSGIDTTPKPWSSAFSS